jgi:hypothetical protein
MINLISKIKIILINHQKIVLTSFSKRKNHLKLILWMKANSNNKDNVFFHKSLTQNSLNTNNNTLNRNNSFVVIETNNPSINKNHQFIISKKNSFSTLTKENISNMDFNHVLRTQKTLKSYSTPISKSKTLPSTIS